MKKKVLFADLDGTLITTISERTFPLGIWDMKFRFNTLDAIKNYGFECLVIITNQGGIEKGIVNERNFVKGKMEYVRRSLEEYLGIPVEYQYCATNDRSSFYRKPNTGMLRSPNIRYFFKKCNIDAAKEVMLMIGDASGNPGQFSDTDRKTAENFGIDYMDVYDFTREFLPEQ